MTFHYQGYALGVGGTFVRPYRTVIPSQGSAALCIYGGYGSDAAGPSYFEPGVSFDSARADVQGVGGEGGIFVTIATATVYGLNIQGVVKADRIVSQLTSIHSGVQNEEPRIHVRGSRIEGLNIAGVDLGLSYFDDDELPTQHAAFVDKYTTNAEFRGLADTCFNWVQPEGEVHQTLLPLYQWCWTCEQQHRPPQANGRILASMVKGIERSCEGSITVQGNVVTVPNFGRIFLGELIIERGLRRLNMIHFSLGSPTEGDGTAGSSQTNGSTFP